MKFTNDSVKRPGRLFTGRILLMTILAVSLFALSGCGDSAEDETEQSNTTETDNNVDDATTTTVAEETTTEAATEAATTEEQTTEAVFEENWYQTWAYFVDEETEEYFEVRCEDSTDGTKVYVLNYGNDWEYLYLTTTPDAYTETDDDGYKYYDTGEDHNVMTWYPGTHTLVLMTGYTTYTCSAVDVAYGVDPYGFATEDATWWDTTSYRCNMDIKYATSISSGESYYEIEIEWSGGDSDDNIWEIAHGTYDEASNAIVFSDCRYYTLTWYVDGTEVETDVFTNGTGSIVMDENNRLYWNDDEQDSGASCVFENASYSYKNLYVDFAGTWTYSFTDTVYGYDVPKTYMLEITETEDGSFDVVYHYSFDAAAESVGLSESIYTIEDIEYDRTTGITFYLPEKYTRLQYSVSGNSYDTYSEQIEWYENQAYTITSLDGMLTLSEDGEEIAWLSRAN